MSDDKVILTPDQAKDMLADGKYVHNFANPGAGLMIGCDYDRADAFRALDEAESIELGGPGSMQMKHPIVCHHPEGNFTFFAANMEKVAAFEAALEKAA